MQDFIEWLKSSILTESDTRYSIEVNYRTKVDEALASYAKICLGYASAGLKKLDHHVKQVFEEEPFRILVSSRNWDDGEWVVCVTWNPKKHCYIISKGFYNKDRKSISVQSSSDCDATNAAEIVTQVRNQLHDLKDKQDRHVEKLKKVPLKRGPK